MDNRETVLLPILLKRSGRLIDRHIDNLLKQHDIARSQYRVLYHVAKRGELTQKELTDILQVQGSTLTLIVDVLVKKSWLVRVPDDSDRRIKKLRLTSKGKQRFKNIPNPAQNLHQRIIKSLSKEDANKLKKQLEKIIYELSQGG